jgi:hypothetical protein
MACGVYPDAPIQYWLNYEFVDGAVCFYGDHIGVTAFMLVFFGVTMIGLYNSTGSMMLPIIVTIALGPMMLFLLPAVGIQAVVIVTVFGLSVGGLWLWSRLSE